ncbi:hypothetical protein PGT21_027766 [Puccinia graminis f. sp. tritici]|uniref:Uncharacterized protein n=1 Tax=Puccinia graminis f. sp. tritici TaxID=56615 RepID=A0A5B0PHU3_PUCGR|nr:hypothetical protein PGT21_027766 [Puccinia graminis f. sp. tritici]KAA1128092.1 hypothetical protein PGTUg99_006072 [Puccinia graminis f. sp. tritici]
MGPASAAHGPMFLSCGEACYCEKLISPGVDAASVQRQVWPLLLRIERTGRSVTNGLLVKPNYSLERGVILAGRLSSSLDPSSGFPAE